MESVKGGVNLSDEQQLFIEKALEGHDISIIIAMQDIPVQAEQLQIQRRERRSKR